jgi:hypothetical protein
MVEEPGYLQNVIYGDTDSVFIVIPANIKDLAAEQKIELANKVGPDINNRIQNYLKNTYFKRANISYEYNMTFFKTEIIIDSIMFIPNVKKQYAYMMIVKDGRILKEPVPDYKGIQVVRIDATKLGQNLLREMIEKIILNSNIKKEDRKTLITKAVHDAHNKLIEDCSNFNFDDITISGKWNKDQSMINSMKIYNFISNTNTFLPASSGKFIYCKFHDMQKFKKLGLDEKYIKAVSVPYNYNSEFVKNWFTEYKIEIDFNAQWERVYTTTCQRIVDLVKKG